MNQEIGTEEHFISVPNGKLFTKTWRANKSSSVPVLLFHDSLGCVEMWRDFPAKLAQTLGRNIIAYDRLGFGRSTARTALPSPQFVHEEASVFFPRITQELALKEVHLFGHSVGGSMALACAAKHPSVCLSVVTESSQVFVEEKTLKGIADAKAAFENQSRFEKLKHYHGEKAEWVLKAWTDVWLSKSFANWSLAPELPKVECDVLAIHGENDEYGSRAFPKMICDLVHGQTRMEILSNCGHVPHREKPEDILSFLENFYKKYN